MFAFLYTDKKPVTKKARGRASYEQDLKMAFRRYYPGITPANGQYYGIVYYFHQGLNPMDADNLSKPVFDALKNEIYPDDKILELKRSGVVDLKKTGIEELNLTKVPPNVLGDFFRALDESPHILYVEVGNLDYGMFEFSCEQ